MGKVYTGWLAKWMRFWYPSVWMPLYLINCPGDFVILTDDLDVTLSLLVEEGYSL